jgi:hypothetical protein
MHDTLFDYSFRKFLLIVEYYKTDISQVDVPSVPANVGRGPVIEVTYEGSINGILSVKIRIIYHVVT